MPKNTTLGWLGGLSLAACVHGAGPAPDPSPDALAGDHRIDVAFPDGSVDPMWIYVADPGPGSHPIVVYGHGQGTGDLVNCDPDGPPTIPDARAGRLVADALAELGYLGVSIEYRNEGDGAPVGASVKLRDHHGRDARAMLAAAHWAADRQDDSRVVLIGHSMGTYPALWAGADLPELAGARGGLNLRSIVTAGMMGNHIANVGRNAAAYTGATAADRTTAVVGGVLTTPTIRAVERAVGVIDSTTIADVTTDLTPSGRALFEALAVSAAPAGLTGCEGLGSRAALCNDACAAAVVADRFPTSTDPGPISDYLTADAIAAMGYWHAPDRIDPGPSSPSSLLAAMREQSPVYAEGTLAVPRVLALMSSKDHVLVQQGAEAAQLYLDWLGGTGAVITAPLTIATDAGAVCEHGDYTNPARAACGWRMISEELATAFAP